MKHVKLFEQFLNRKEDSLNENEGLKLKDIVINKKSPIVFVLEVSFFLNGDIVTSYLTADTEQEAKKLKDKIEKGFKSGKIVSPGGVGYYAFNESINEKKDEKYIAYVDDRRGPGGSDKDIKKDYNLEVKDRTSSGFSIVGTKEDIEGFIEDYGIYLDDDEPRLYEGVVSIKGGRILAHKVLNKLVDMEVIPVKKKTEDLVEAIASLLASASLNEAMTKEAIDVKYWTDYNTDTSGQSDPEFAIKSKDFEATFKEAVKDWNDRGEDPISMGEAEKVKKIAKEFFNKAGWISVNITQAMIAQES